MSYLFSGKHAGSKEMKEKLEALIAAAYSEIEVAEMIISEGLIKVKSAEDLPIDHPAYEALAKYAHVHDFCQGRVSAFKEVMAILGGVNENGD